MAAGPPPARVLCHSSASQQCLKPGVGQSAKQVQGRRVRGTRPGSGAPGASLRNETPGHVVFRHRVGTVELFCVCVVHAAVGQKLPGGCGVPGPTVRSGQGTSEKSCLEGAVGWMGQC